MWLRGSFLLLEVLVRLCFNALVQVNAAIVLAPGVPESEEVKEAITKHLKQHLSAFKLPKKTFFVSELPRTATGKIQRRFVAQAMLNPGAK